MAPTSIAVAISVLLTTTALAQTEQAPPPNDFVTANWQQLNDPAIQKRPPFRIFDNLYYVGIDWVSAYLLTTSEGHILIDSLYGEFADHALEGIRALGFDPVDLKYVLVTHGHFDHAGGARRIQEATGARVGMTAADWRLAIETPGVGRARFEPPPRDLVLADGDVVRLGDTAVRCHVTPGHTPGVLSLEFEVHDGDHRHRAFVFGGVGLNFDGVERTEMYLDSLRRIRSLAGIEVNLPNHPSAGWVFDRAAGLAGRRPGEPHPFVAAEEFGAWLERLRQRAEDKLAEERLRSR